MDSKQDAVVVSLKQRFKALYGHAYTEAPPGVILRRARADDYDDVMAINKDVFDGLDLLPELYHTHVQDPDCYMFVAVKDNRVVSFYMQQVFDNGKAAMGRSARTLPQYGGEGIFRALRSYGNLTTWKERPTIGLARGHSGHPTFFIDKVKSKAMPYTRIIEVRDVVPIAAGVSFGDLEGTCSEGFTQELADRYPGIGAQMRGLTLAGKDRLVSILSDREAVKRLFPGGVMSYGFRCHAASVENITTAGLLDHRCQVFVDSAAQTLFVSYIYQCQAGLAVELEFYGGTSRDAIMAAVVKVLPLARANYRQGNIFVLGVFEESTHLEDLQRALEPFPFFTGKKISAEKLKTIESVFSHIPASQL